MKKYVIFSAGVLAFAVIYYLTESWKLSLIILGIAIVYLIWVIGFELGFRSNKDKSEKMFDSMKREHQDKIENNPTLR